MKQVNQFGSDVRTFGHELGQRVYEACRITGHFTLRSGASATEYFDKYMFEGDPRLMTDLTPELGRLVPHGTEILAGLELGGVPLATLLMYFLDLPMVQVRKEAKPYGTMKLAEGPSVKGKKVCIIEDVVTTGGQIIRSANALLDLAAVVDTVLCVILRDEQAIHTLGNIGLTLKPLFKWQGNTLVPFNA